MVHYQKASMRLHEAEGFKIDNFLRGDIELPVKRSQRIKKRSKNKRGKSTTQVYYTGYRSEKPIDAGNKDNEMGRSMGNEDRHRGTVSRGEEGENCMGSDCI